MRFIPDAVTSKIALTALKFSKHSPNILFGAGIVGVAATAVLASRATLKLDSVLDEHNNILSDINEVEHEDYSDQDRVKDKALLYVQTTIKITKLYGPALVVGGLAVAALSGSHTILTRRNAGLAAAYAAVDKGFKEYRARVAENVGEEKERELHRGVVTEKKSEPSADGKSVKLSEKKVAKAPTTYGKLFHQGNPNWHPRPEINIMFLRQNQTYMNDMLKARGFLFLSDVYDALGFEQTPASRVVGWLADPKYGGDGVIDFGIFEDNAQSRLWEYVTGHEGEIYVDFNVDGDIMNKI